MATLLVGFDSAWTLKKSGAIVGVLHRDDGTFHEFGPPQRANFKEAATFIRARQAESRPRTTVVLLDQPIIVKNEVGQRPVENIVDSPVGLRLGGVQPAFTSKKEMFGADAPVWSFLTEFAADPIQPVRGTCVLETYPVLAMIALGWAIPHRTSGRLPKYNPERKKTFQVSDWQYVCGLVSDEYIKRSLREVAAWIGTIRANSSPSKGEQDGLDACVCLLVALHLSERNDCLMVGEHRTGYMVVPYGLGLVKELQQRCQETGRESSAWVRPFRLILEEVSGEYAESGAPARSKITRADAFVRRQRDAWQG